MFNRPKPYSYPDVALYGNEDGTIPATFRVVFMVRGSSTLPSVLTEITLDWMETCSHTAAAAGKRLREGELEGCALTRRFYCTSSLFVRKWSSEQALSATYGNK